MMRALQFSQRIATILLGSLFLGLVGASTAGPSVPQAAPAQPTGWLVKFKSAMAQEVEASLERTTLEAGMSSARVRAWLEKHQVKALRPLHDQALRQKLARGRSEQELAEGIRARFHQRAQRARGAVAPGLLRTYAVEAQGASALELEAAVQRAQADPEVEWAQVDHVVRAQFVPNDPWFASAGSWGQTFDDLYGVKSIACPGAWDLTSGSGVVVAVIDSGIDYTHIDLTNRLWLNTGEVPGNGIDEDHNGYVDDTRGWDFIGARYDKPQADSDPMDVMGHGTHVAGTIAAEGNNGLGIIGVAWGARVMAVRALDNAGYGTDSALAQAIRYAADNGADIINASWGGKGTAPAVEEAVNYAVGLGVVFVAAAGNAGADLAGYYPASFAAAISVGACDANNNKASFSNYGQRLDVAAPGVSVLSLRGAHSLLGTPLNDDYALMSGTSMAAPHVAGAAALILALHPTYGPEEVRQVLRASADDIGTPGFDPDFGYGRLNANRAVTTGPVLQARIFTPANDSVLLPETTFSGVAQGAGFASYVLDYGEGDPPFGWTLIAQSATPADHTVLGVLDASNLPDGRYTIRLQAFDNAGRSFEDRIQLRLENTAIRSPGRPASPAVAEVYKPGLALNISGTAIGSKFRQFGLEWARGIDPATGWSSNGLALAGDGLIPVTNGVLATWNSCVITQAGYYSLRLQTDNTDFSNEARSYVYWEPDLYSGNWPRWLDQAPVENESLVPVRDGAGRTRLAAVTPYLSASSPQSRLWQFEVDGSAYHTLELARGSYLQPAVAELDGQPGEEIVVTEWKSGGQGSGSLRVVRPDKSSYVIAPAGFSNFQYSLVTLADLDGDGALELVAWGTDRRSSEAWVWAWRTNGQLFSTNYPVHFPDANATLYSYPKVKRVVPLDVDADGRTELLVVSGDGAQSFSLRLLRGDGRPAEWPTPLYNGYFRDLVTGDLNHDGRPEIVFSYSEAGNSNSNSSSIVQVLAPDGTPCAGWPLSFGAVAPGQFALGDLDRDGTNEIIFSTYRDLRVYRADGTKFPGAWPVHGTSSFQGHGWPVVADIDGDGWPEIVVMRDDLIPLSGGDADYCKEAKLLAYRRDGSLARSWQLLGANGNQPVGNGTPIIGDFDGDGLTEIAVNYQLLSGGGYGGWMVEGVVSVLRTGAPWKAHRGDWPMNFHDPRNSSGSFIAAKLKAVRNGGRITFSWPVQPEASWVQYADDPVGGAWQPLSGRFVRTNGLNTITVDPAGPHRWYRLKYPGD